MTTSRRPFSAYQLFLSALSALALTLSTFLSCLGIFLRPARPFLLLPSAFLLLTSLPSCTTIPTALDPVAVPLQYKTIASPGEFPAVPACASTSAILAVDGRRDGTIGKRYVETDPSITAPITAGSDVATWVKAGASDAVQRVGIAQQSSGPILRITVRQIVVSENVARRSGFEGRIQIRAELMRKGGGVCWQDQFEGTSENYGYSGQNDNYQETLNHALDRAMIRLLSDPGFQQKVCTCGG